MRGGGQGSPQGNASSISAQDQATPLWTSRTSPGRSEVWALERSHRFLNHLQQAAAARRLGNIRPLELDLGTDPLGVAGADAAWGRWIFAFLPNPKQALIKLVDAVRPGGVIVLHEYLDYSSWRLTPRAPAFERFVAAAMDSWRETGGEPDIGLELPRWLAELGCEIVTLNPIVDVVGPANFVWQWPSSFVDVNLTRLADLGKISSEDASLARDALTHAESGGHSLMVTPIVLEIIARRKS
jgi:SAM-dependent methyltransferase